MIVYNIRYNGPYEYDKFVLNIFQLYNKVYDEKKLFNGHKIFSQLQELDDKIKELTQCDIENTIVEKMILQNKARGNL